MASVKIILRSDRTNSRNQHPLWLRITKDRRSSYITLDIELAADQWDERKCRVRKSHPQSTRLNAIIAQKIADAEATAVEIESSNKYTASNKLRENIKGISLGDFFEYADKYIAALALKEKIGTYRRAKCVIHKLREYVGGKPLYFNMLTVSFLNEYETHLAGTLKNRKNTIHANFRLIRTIVNRAIREDLMPVELNPFTKFTLVKEQTQRAFLTEEELIKLEALSFCENHMINHHRNIYVFSAYAGGLRISDVLLLRWKNFDGEKISIQIQKTGIPLTIKLPKRALQIIDKYKSANSTKEDFIFPLLKICPSETRPMAIHNAISNATAYTNKDLKKISALAGIEKHLSFHSSRHTWATRALRKGMRIEYVSKLMGHAAIKETQIYARIINEELDKAMEVFN